MSSSTANNDSPSIQQQSAPPLPVPVLGNADAVPLEVETTTTQYSDEQRTAATAVDVSAAGTALAVGENSTKEDSERSNGEGETGGTISSSAETKKISTERSGQEGEEGSTTGGNNDSNSSSSSSDSSSSDEEDDDEKTTKNNDDQVEEKATDEQDDQAKKEEAKDEDDQMKKVMEQMKKEATDTDEHDGQSQKINLVPYSSSSENTATMDAAPVRSTPVSNASTCSPSEESEVDTRRKMSVIRQSSSVYLDEELHNYVTFFLEEEDEDDPRTAKLPEDDDSMRYFDPTLNKGKPPLPPKIVRCRSFYCDKELQKECGVAFYTDPDNYAVLKMIGSGLMAPLN